VTLFSVSFLGALDHTIVSTSISTIAGDLGALQQMSWVLVAYTLAATVSLPVLGKLADNLGARRVFLVSLTTFLLASIACGFAQEMSQLVAARVVQGVSSAGIQLMSQTIVASVTTPRERPKLLSILGASFPVAIIVGPFLGGLISDNLGWQWVFWINVPLGIAALVLATIAIPRIEGTDRGRFDVAGAVTFTTGLVALVLAVSWIVDPALTGVSLVLLAVAAVAFTAFFLIEVRVEDPFIPLAIFRNRTVAAGIALSAIIGIGLFSITSYMPTYIQMTYRTTATVSGLVPVATVMGMLIASLATGALSSRSGRYRRYAILGTSLAAAGLLAMSLLPVGLPLWVPMVLMFVVGLGTGCFMSLVVAVVQSAVDRSRTGVVTATTNLVRQVGSTLGTATVGAIIGVGIVSRLPDSIDAATLTPAIARAASTAVQLQIAEVYSDVMRPVFAVLGLVYALGIIAAIILPSGRLSDETETEPSETEPGDAGSGDTEPSEPLTRSV
jgi:EmrB/QacA subfamily drug resistance transporter